MHPSLDKQKSNFHCIISKMPLCKTFGLMNCVMFHFNEQEKHSLFSRPVKVTMVSILKLSKKRFKRPRKQAIMTIIIKPKRLQVYQLLNRVHSAQSEEILNTYTSSALFSTFQSKDQNNKSDREK